MISQRARALPWLAGFAVMATAILVLAPTLDAYFLADDFGLVQLYASKPLPYFLTLFFTPWTEGMYGYRPDELRPFVALAYRIDAIWGAANPFGYHVGNIALHAATALLVLAIARRLVGLGWPAATFAGGAFAVMPVHAEVG